MKITLTILLCILLLPAFAQQNFQPGSIQKNNGETVQGWIDYRAWGRNPKSIRFKEKEDGAVTTFTISDLNAFAVTGKESYIKTIVLKDVRTVNEKDVTIYTPDSTVTDTAFLRVITEGRKLNLYELVDEKPHYYIKDSTGQYQELQYKIYLIDSDGKYILNTKPIFRDQLRMYVLQDESLSKLEKSLQRTRYNESELSSVVNAINGNANAPSKKGGGAKATFFVSGGASYSRLKTSGISRLENMNYSSSIRPALGVGVDFVSARQFKAFALRLEALYSSADFKGHSTTNWNGNPVNREYLLRFTNIAPTVSFLYSPFRAPAYRVYAGVGLAYNFTFYQRNKFTEGDGANPIDPLLDLSKGWLSVPACVGGIVNDFEFILSTRIAGAFEKYIFADVKASNYTLLVAYRF